MQGFLIAARFVHFAAAILLTGVFAFECLVARPALRRTGAAPTCSPALGWLAWASLVLAIGSGAVWLVEVAAGMSGKPVGAALSQGVVAIVLTRTQFGEDWLLRFALAVLLGFCLLGRRRAAGAMGWTSLFLAAAMLASLAWAGHGGSTPGPAGDLHLAADFLHLLAAGLWLGTLPPLILFLGEVRRTGGPNWSGVAVIATRRYSTLAIASVTVLLAGGLVNTWFLTGTVPALVGTEYGRLLLAKIGLFIAMLIVAAVNLLRLTPRLASADGGTRNVVRRTVFQLRRNSLIEASLGFCVLAIVGALGTLPPGLHTEPGWPLPFRVDLEVLTLQSVVFLAILGVFASGCAIAAVTAAAAGHYRRMTAFGSGLIVCVVLGWVPLRAAIEPAYPTSFYAPGEPYAAPSVVRGAALYAKNCALCHGTTGRGEGPVAAGLPVRPADLTAPHLFAHTEGDLFWWVSEGTDNGVMPGFADVMSVNARWDVINFIRARAAAVLASGIGPEVTTAAALEVPDFAFERAGKQQTLEDALKRGPVLLVLFAAPTPVARLAQLAAEQRRLSTAGLDVLAVEIGPSARQPTESGAPLSFVVDVSADVTSTLALYGPPEDRGETDLMLDRAGNVRARWTRGGRDGLPDADTLVAVADGVARFAIAPQSHTGHAH